MSSDIIQSSKFLQLPTELRLHIYIYLVFDLDWKVKSKSCYDEKTDKGCEACQRLAPAAGLPLYMPVALHLYTMKAQMYQPCRDFRSGYFWIEKQQWESAKISPDYVSLIKVCRRMQDEVLDVICSKAWVTVDMETYIFTDEPFKVTDFKIKNSRLLQRAQFLDITVYIGPGEGKELLLAAQDLEDLAAKLSPRRRMVKLGLAIRIDVEQPVVRHKGVSSMKGWKRFTASLKKITRPKGEITVVSAPSWLREHSRFGKSLAAAVGDVKYGMK